MISVTGPALLLQQKQQQLQVSLTMNVTLTFHKLIQLKNLMRGLKMRHLLSICKYFDYCDVCVLSAELL